MTGLLMLLAILVHSRIGLLLAMLGAGAVAVLRVWLRDGQPWSATDLTAAFNGMLAALAIGGVWFVPQPSSMLLATASAALTTLVSYALFPLLGPLTLPVLSLPFVLTVQLVLTAARMREQDRWPRSTIPADHPEEALSRHLVRIRRFGNLAWLPFRLPFRGEWFVSQGHDGEHTHQGLWRHGLDFEGRTPDGKSYTGDGKELRDYVCYGLPVVAAGAGTVALVEDGVADNRPGEMNTQENWGNAVVIQHGTNLFSVCAHLQPKSIRVKVGDVVTPGMDIGRCGNSGRSPFPHLHFQIQRSKLLGSSTIAFDFGDVVVRRNDELRLETHTVPDEGAFVRPAQRDDGLARSMSFSPGDIFDLTHKESGRTERAKVDVNLAGERALVSPEARLVFDAYDNGLVFLDYSGSTESLLRFLLLAWARLPFDPSPRITWADTLSRRLFMPRWRRTMADLWIVLVPEFGKLDVSYTSSRETGKVLVEGRAEAWTAKSAISLNGTEHTITIHHGSTTSTIVMKKVNDDPGVKP
jgi:murein DD-endopeptidase MepM/ murein hydrolase activator NlpD